MFRALVVCHLALVAATPFHKYPYVFLLDVGNEELEKTNTEQIRLSVPGGSIALRYPAVGAGDTIAHVRVSGIDFGTDLKANIVDGGPGYKYVVLVFMGNQGTPYDAVMTVQTVSDEDIDGNQNGDVSNNYNYYKISDNNDSSEIINSKSKEVTSAEDENVSSEDTSDELNASNDVNTKNQLTQQSSNVYAYANSASNSDEDTEDEDDDDDDALNENDTHKQYAESNSDVEFNSSVEDNSNQDEKSNEPEPSHFNDDYGNESADNENESANDVKKKSYEKYRPTLPLRAYGGVRIYPQYAVPFALPNSDSSVYSLDSAVDWDHEANDDDDRGDSDKYKDSNNNYFESDDVSAVES